MCFEKKNPKCHHHFQRNIRNSLYSMFYCTLLYIHQDFSYRNVYENYMPTLQTIYTSKQSKRIGTILLHSLPWPLHFSSIPLHSGFSSSCMAIIIITARSASTATPTHGLTSWAATTETAACKGNSNGHAIAIPLNQNNEYIEERSNNMLGRAVGLFRKRY